MRCSSMTGKRSEWSSRSRWMDNEQVKSLETQLLNKNKESEQLRNKGRDLHMQWIQLQSDLLQLQEKSSGTEHRIANLQQQQQRQQDRHQSLVEAFNQDTRQYLQIQYINQGLQQQHQGLQGQVIQGGQGQVIKGEQGGAGHMLQVHQQLIQENQGLNTRLKAAKLTAEEQITNKNNQLKIDEQEQKKAAEDIVVRILKEQEEMNILKEKQRENEAVKKGLEEKKKQLQALNSELVFQEQQLAQELSHIKRQMNTQQKDKQHNHKHYEQQILQLQKQLKQANLQNQKN